MPIIQTDLDEQISYSLIDSSYDDGFYWDIYEIKSGKCYVSQIFRTQHEADTARRKNKLILEES